MPKVREVFAKAYGAIPEGATCHVGWGSTGVLLSPTYKVRGTGSVFAAVKPIWDEFVRATPIGGDISDQPAAAFSPVFQCAAYDAALDALTKEESATAINRTMRKYDLALHKLAKFSEVTKAQPDPRTVIALADAWMVADDEFVRERNPDMIVTRIDNVKATKKRFREASREFWAALSVDGTGESPVLSTHLDVMGELYEQDETEDTIDDGFGNAWAKCRPDCGMYVVRPGKAACGYEGTTGCGFYPGNDVMEEAQ